MQVNVEKQANPSGLSKSGEGSREGRSDVEDKGKSPKGDTASSRKGGVPKDGDSGAVQLKEKVGFIRKRFQKVIGDAAEPLTEKVVPELDRIKNEVFVELVDLADNLQVKVEALLHDVFKHADRMQDGIEETVKRVLDTLKEELNKVKQDAANREEYYLYLLPVVAEKAGLHLRKGLFAKAKDDPTVLSYGKWKQYRAGVDNYMFATPKDCESDLEDGEEGKKTEDDGDEIKISRNPVKMFGNWVQSKFKKGERSATLSGRVKAVLGRMRASMDTEVKISKRGVLRILPILIVSALMVFVSILIAIVVRRKLRNGHLEARLSKKRVIVLAVRCLISLTFSVPLAIGIAYIFGWKMKSETINKLKMSFTALNGLRTLVDGVDMALTIDENTINIFESFDVRQLPEENGLQKRFQKVGDKFGAFSKEFLRDDGLQDEDLCIDEMLEVYKDVMKQREVVINGVKRPSWNIHNYKWKAKFREFAKFGIFKHSHFLKCVGVYDPICLLWSMCYVLLSGAGTSGPRKRLQKAIVELKSMLNEEYMNYFKKVRSSLELLDIMENKYSQKYVQDQWITPKFEYDGNSCHAIKDRESKSNSVLMDSRIAKEVGTEETNPLWKKKALEIMNETQERQHKAQEEVQQELKDKKVFQTNYQFVYGWDCSWFNCPNHVYQPFNIPVHCDFICDVLDDYRRCFQDVDQMVKCTPPDVKLQVPVLVDGKNKGLDVEVRSSAISEPLQIVATILGFVTSLGVSVLFVYLVVKLVIAILMYEQRNKQTKRKTKLEEMEAFHVLHRPAYIAPPQSVPVQLVPKGTVDANNALMMGKWTPVVPKKPYIISDPEMKVYEKLKDGVLVRRNFDLKTKLTAGEWRLVDGIDKLDLIIEPFESEEVPNDDPRKVGKRLMKKFQKRTTTVKKTKVPYGRDKRAQWSETAGRVVRQLKEQKHDGLAFDLREAEYEFAKVDIERERDLADQQKRKLENYEHYAHLSETEMDAVMVKLIAEGKANGLSEDYVIDRVFEANPHYAAFALRRKLRAVSQQKESNDMAVLAVKPTEKKFYTPPKLEGNDSTQLVDRGVEKKLEAIIDDCPRFEDISRGMRGAQVYGANEFGDRVWKNSGYQFACGFVTNKHSKAVSVKIGDSFYDLPPRCYPVGDTELCYFDCQVPDLQPLKANDLVTIDNITNNQPVSLVALNSRGNTVIAPGRIVNAQPQKGEYGPEVAVAVSSQNGDCGGVYLTQGGRICGIHFRRGPDQQYNFMVPITSEVKKVLVTSKNLI